MQDGPPSTTSVDVLGGISRDVVQLLRRSAGRGPTQAKSLWAGDDALLVLLGEGLTKVEHTLWNHGRSETARAYRQAVMETLQPELRALVERRTGRRVVALLGCTHHDPDVVAEVFLLEPLGGSDSSDAGSGDAGGRPASPEPAAGPDGRVR